MINSTSSFNYRCDGGGGGGGGDDGGYNVNDVTIGVVVNRVY